MAMPRHSRKYRPPKVAVYRDPRRLNTPVVLELGEVSVALTEDQAQQITREVEDALHRRRPASRASLPKPLERPQ